MRYGGMAFGGAPRETCRAPFVSFRLEPNGDVQVCCVNDEFPLGTVADASLKAIWRGSRSSRLRSAIAKGDYSLGCQACGDARAIGMRANTLAVDYDHYQPSIDLMWPRHIEFALSNTCNLQCVQCNGELSSAIRSRREHRPPLRSPYGDAFFDELRDFLPHLDTATFIGGEPFLMPEARRVWDLLLEMELLPEVWVTTNGTVWDDRVEHYLHGLKMGVSLSIDGVEPATIASIRVGADPRALLANRDRFIAATRSYGAALKLNYCVMRQNWREFLPFLLEADELGVRVYAARVLRPPTHSLFHLPVDELRTVLDVMRTQGAAQADQLTTNRTVWDRTLADLTAHLAELDVASVRVDVSRRSHLEFSAMLERLRTDLTTDGGEPPAHLTIRSDQLSRVDSPEWAAFLGLDQCVGLEAAEILPAVERRLGADLAPVPVEGEEHVNGRICAADLDGERIEVHFVSIEDDAKCSHVLIGLVEP